MMSLRLSKLRGLLPLGANSSIGCLSANPTELIWGHAFNSKAEIKDVDYTPEDGLPKEIKKVNGTYDEIKEAARRSGGDPAREWMQGTSAKGSTVYKAAKADKDQLLSGTRRSVEDGTTRHELLRDVWYSNEEAQAFKNSVNQENSGVASKFKEQMHNAADKMDDMKEKFGNAVSSLTGNEEKEQAVNARAVWEATRSEKQKSDENATRKSQLTDEAFGDNPKEKIPRMDKETLPDPLDTPH